LALEATSPIGQRKSVSGVSKPKVAFIGTGGTIASLGKGPLDLQDYGAAGQVMHADAILAHWPDVGLVADVIAVPFRNIPSPAIGYAEWHGLVALCADLVAKHPDLAGIVIGHGTATLEETAYFLSLTVKVTIPVVLVGSQRPSSALSSDAGMNLVNAVRVAASPDARGMGVLVLLNDEIHAAREVTKTSTLRLQTFRTPDFGVLGHADGDAVEFYRRPVRRSAPDTVFDVGSLAALPRVDIAYSYAGSDGAAVRAFIDAGAKGIVAAGFAPGFCTPEEVEALRDATRQGIVVVQSTRAGSGRTFRTTRLREAGFLIADNLNPQKARILLALALSVTTDADTIMQMFRTY
jgi:L-asparaginase